MLPNIYVSLLSVFPCPVLLPLCVKKLELHGTRVVRRKEFGNGRNGERKLEMEWNGTWNLEWNMEFGMECGVSF